MGSSTYTVRTYVYLELLYDQPVEQDAVLDHDRQAREPIRAFGPRVANHHQERDEAHEEHQAVLDWYGERFDPDDLELDTVEAMLGRIRASRRKGPAKGSRSSSKRVWRRRAQPRGHP